MLFLDKFRLESILSARGISINKLAESCGISRQSIYNMYNDTPVFNTTFEKIRQFLNVDYRALARDSTVAQEIMKQAPDRIKIAAYLLTNFVEERRGDLLFFSSEGRGKYGQKFDWNFGIYLKKEAPEESIAKIRQDLIERVSPYTLEIINLNRAPLWLKLIIKSNYVRLFGNTSEDKLFYSDR